MAPVAKPGYSNHQLGLAIDVADVDKGKVTHAEQSGCNRKPYSTNLWAWLHTDAKTWGFDQLRSERWHWDTNLGSRMDC
jgi:hypothetical protein